ncbi:MAG TPA: glycine cleavage system protein GcvH [Kofleriaceae bacterium]
MSNVPTQFRYTNDHEWLHPEGDQWKVGITQFATNQLGDITIVDIPSVGRQVAKGDQFGTIESVKSVSELYAPVSGKIIAVNETLADSPENVNTDSYGDGWLVTIEPSDKAELAELMDAAAYTKHIESQ